MRILLVADKESPYIWDYFDKERFEGVDLIISCGDLKAEYLSFLVTMVSAPLFYVHGNHDARYITHPPEGCVSIDGKFVTFNGLRIIGLGGTQRYNRGHFQYTEREMKKRVSKLRYKIKRNKGFDILVTHAPAYNINDGKDLCHTGFKVFRELIEVYSPKYFFHGHQHLNYGRHKRIVHYNNTTIINSYGYYLLDI
jgi:Icc-related predicted phosphoesterase